MFKITNEQLIQMAAVDAGLDPFAEYCTRGVYEAAGYKVRRGEKPVLVLELWCPRQSKEQAETLSTSESQEQGEKAPGMFFAFKKCHLYTRSQVVSAEELAQEKEARKLRKQMEKQFKAAVMAQGGIKPSDDYESIPKWCKRKNGAAIDEAVAEVAAAGFRVEDADSLFDMIQAI
jgi:hypothetical protein